MKVATCYRDNLHYWKMIRCFVEGKDNIQDYLREINIMDKSQENIERNKQYKDGAIYLNVAARTRNALVGAIFRKDASVEVPPQIEYMLENADGNNSSIFQVSKEAIKNLIEIGRHGMLVDFPKNNGETLEQTINLKAKICNYKAESIVDWETDDNRLVMVKLKEDETKYRLLKLKDGYYIQEVYKDEQLTEVIEPKIFDGRRLDFIPFIFIGSETNTSNIQTMPLLDIVRVSKGHYQNSADYEELLNLIGQPTLAATVPNKQWFDEMMPDGRYNIGSRGLVPLPENGTAQILQVSPTQVHQEAMKHKEEQMVMIGARLISSGQAAETAEAVKMRYSGENSVLDNLSQNASEAIEFCLECCCLFMGGDITKVKFELNREYFDTTMTAQEIMAYIQLADRGDIAQYDLRKKLRKTGLLDRTDEEIEADVR